MSWPISAWCWSCSVPGSALVVRETLAALGDIDVAGLVRDIADDLAENGAALALKERLEHGPAPMACHGSVRAGRRPHRRQR